MYFRSNSMIELNEYLQCAILLHSGSFAYSPHIYPYHVSNHAFYWVYQTNQDPMLSNPIGVCDLCHQAQIGTFLKGSLLTIMHFLTDIHLSPLTVYQEGHFAMSAHATPVFFNISTETRSFKLARATAVFPIPPMPQIPIIILNVISFHP